jgi:hypothetical protein
MRKLFVFGVSALFVLAWAGASIANMSIQAFVPSQFSGSNLGPPGVAAEHAGRPAILQVFDVVDSVPAPGSAHMGLAWDGTYLWLASNEVTPILLYKIDPVTGQAVDTITTGVNSYILGFTYLNGYFWLQEWFSTGTTYKIDPVTGAIVGSFVSPASTNSRGLADDGTYLWIASTGGLVGAGTLYQVDTLGATQTTVGMGSVINWPMGMTYNKNTGYMWVADDDVMNDVNELDISGPNAVLVSEHMPPGSPASEIPEGLTNDGAFLWYSAYYAPWIWKINITPLAHDAKTDKIYTPSTIVTPGAPVTIKARVRNSGQNTESFTAYARVESLGTQIFETSTPINNLPDGDTAFVAFTPDWNAPVEGNSYVVKVFTKLTGDLYPGNDTARVSTFATFTEKMCIDDGVMANAHAWFDAENIWAVQYTPTEYPAYVDSVQVYILSGGDPYYPWPDAVHQPFVIEVWDEAGGQPSSVLFEDTVLADDNPPSWVMAYPSIEITSGNFYPTHHQLGPNPTCEGMGVDAAVNNGSRNWARIAGAWQSYGAGVVGDLMICAYVRYRGLYDVGPTSIVAPGRIVQTGIPVIPEANVMNQGRMTAIGFNVACSIDSAGNQIYWNYVTIDSLKSDSVVNVTLPPWTPGPPLNDYHVAFYTNYTADPRPSNDTLHAIASSFQLMPLLYSPAAMVIPTIDGLMEAGEWNDAYRYDVSDVFQKKGMINFPGSAILYVKNDVDLFYVAINAKFDVTRTEFDKIGIAFDDNRDNAYPAPGEDSEGLLTLYYTSLLDFVSYTSLHSDGSQGKPYGVNFAAGTGFPSGNEQYEIAIPFGDLDEELDADPLDTVGMFLFAADSVASGSEYGGWWFQDVEANQWDKPAFYGDIIFSNGVGVTEGRPSKPTVTSFRLDQNFPNPFGDFTIIAYAIPSFAGETSASVRIFDATGRVVTTLLDKTQAPGCYKLMWNGTDDSGSKLAAGTYFVQFRSGGFSASKRLVLVR